MTAIRHACTPRTRYALKRAPKLTNSLEHRLLPRYRLERIADRARGERHQALVLADALDANPTKTIPLRHELTKPGDTAQLRGIPVLGAGAGAIRDTLPHLEGVSRADRAASLRDRTRF